jgi:tRNA A37 methylthiotransferase MiaB
MEKNQTMVGSVRDVLIEGLSKTDKNMLAGRTTSGKLVNIRPPAMIRTDAANESSRLDTAKYAGLILPVRLTEAGTFSFIGEPV